MGCTFILAFFHVHMYCCLSARVVMNVFTCSCFGADARVRASWISAFMRAIAPPPNTFTNALHLPYCCLCPAVFYFHLDLWHLLFVSFLSLMSSSAVAVGDSNRVRAFSHSPVAPPSCGSAAMTSPSTATPPSFSSWECSARKIEPSLQRHQ